MSQITLQTRITDASGVIDAFSELMNRAERRIHAELLSGRKWTGDIAVSLYGEFGISAKLIESAYAARQAKVKSAQEVATLHAQELSHKLEAKRKQIVAKSARISRLRKDIWKSAETICKGEVKLEKLLVALDGSTEAKRPMALQRLKSMLGVIHNERHKLADSHTQIGKIKQEIHQHWRRASVLESKLGRAREASSIRHGTE